MRISLGHSKQACWLLVPTMLSAPAVLAAAPPPPAAPVPTPYASAAVAPTGSGAAPGPPRDVALEQGPPEDTASGRPRRPPPHQSAPRWDSAKSYRSATAGEELVIELVVTDDDLDDLSVTSPDLPEGARLEARGQAGSVTATVTWPLGKHASGKTMLHLVASDGTHKASTEITVFVSNEWDSYFMPGVQYGAYQPRASDRYGAYHGPAIELVFASWIHKNDKRGPSHGRVHLDMQLLTSTKAGLPAAFDLAYAFDLSMERNPRRSYLIPHFGLRVGAMLNKGLEGKGTLAHVTPVGGLYLYAEENLFVTLQGGYVMPLSADRFDDLRGPRGGLSVSYISW